MLQSGSRDRRLTQAEVLDTALRLVEAEGTERLSMRRLAQELGVTPMAIYRYVGNKEDLLQRVADQVLNKVRRDRGQTWQEHLRFNGIATWRALSQYPGLATFLLNRPLTAEARRNVDTMVHELEEAGLDHSRAEMAWEAYHTYIYGLVALESRFGPGRQSRDSRQKRLEFGLAVWVSGLEAQLAEPGTD